MSRNCWSFFVNVDKYMQGRVNDAMSFLFPLFIEILGVLLIVGFCFYWAQRFLRSSLGNSKLFQTEEKALDDPQDRVAEKEGPKRDSSGDAPDEESWWERAKAWYGRNKRYLGYAMMALAVMGLLYHFFGGSVRKGITVDADLLDHIQQKVEKKSDMGFSALVVEFTSRNLFFDKWTTPEQINGAHLFLKEAEFVKTMVQVFHFYEQNPEQARAVEKPMQVMRDFLDQVLHVMEPADQIYFVDRGLMATTIDRYDRALLDWENAPAMIKTLFRFLTQSDYSGPHQEAFEAYLWMSYDFIKQSDPGAISRLSG